MKVIVAGSRSIGGNRPETELIQKAMRDCRFDIDELVHGGAKGVDSTAANLFTERYEGEITKFGADWESYGKSAGPRRNQKMAEYADALLAIWDGESRGTRDMIEKALDQGLDITVKQVKL